MALSNDKRNKSKIPRKFLAFCIVGLIALVFLIVYKQEIFAWVKTHYAWASTPSSWVETHKPDGPKQQLSVCGEIFTKFVVPSLAEICTILLIVVIWLQLVRQNRALLEQKKVANRTLKHSQKQIAAEQFKNAIAHLGSDKQPVILGGIHALHNLATADPSYRKQTLDILCSFVREETTKPGYKKMIRARGLRDDLEIEKLLSNKDNRIVSTIVIQTIIDLLFRKPETRKIYLFKDEKYSVYNYRADLSDALFWGLILWDSDFTNIDFFQADLSSVNCQGSNFEGARFRKANLNAVRLFNARFSSSNADEGDATIEYRNDDATLLGAHIGGDSFKEHIRKYKKGIIADLHYKTEFTADNINEEGMFYIDDKKASSPNEIFEKVFVGCKPGDLPAEKAKTLAEDLGRLKK